MYYCMAHVAIRLKSAISGPQKEKLFFIVMLVSGKMGNIALHIVLATVKGVKEPWAVITALAPQFTNFVAIWFAVWAIGTIFR